MSKRSKDNQQERCMCFIRRHNRTQSVPWIVHRQHQSHSGACGTHFVTILILIMQIKHVLIKNEQQFLQYTTNGAPN